MSNSMSLFWCSLTVWERRLALVLFVCFSFSENIIYCVCRQRYRTHCQKWYINCLAVTCKVNMNLLIVRHRWGICLPLSSGSRWSSSEDWDKYLTPNYRNPHVLSAYGVGSSEICCLNGRTCDVEAVLTMFSHERNCLSALSLRLLPTLPQQVFCKSSTLSEPRWKAVTKLGLAAAAVGLQTSPV